MTRAADWLPDPTGRHDHRYWDGTSWTDHVADGGVAATDPVGGFLLPPDDEPGWTPQRSWSTGTEPTQPVPTETDATLDLGPLGLPARDEVVEPLPAPEPGDGRPRRRSRRRRRRRRRVIAAVAGAALVGGGLALLLAHRSSHDDDTDAPPPAALTAAVAKALPSLPAPQATCVATLLRDTVGADAAANPTLADQLAQLAASDIASAVRGGVDPCDTKAMRAAIVPTVTSVSGGATTSSTTATDQVPTSTTTAPPLSDQEVEDQLTRQYAATYGLPEATARCVARAMLPPLRRGVDPQSDEGNRALDGAMAGCGATTTTTLATSPTP